MVDQVCFDKVQEGQEIPRLAKNCSTQQLVHWAAGSGDFYQIHYDKDFAIATGLPGIIVHGALKHAFLGQLLWEWVKPRGVVKRFAAQYRGMDFPSQEIICRGVVKRKWREGGENLVELEVWTENAEGQRTTPGSAVVALP